MSVWVILHGNIFKQRMSESDRFEIYINIRLISYNFFIYMVTNQKYFKFDLI